MKNSKQLFMFLAISIILFVVMGVIPAMYFEENIFNVIHHINQEPLKSVEDYQSQFQEIKNLSINEDNHHIVFKFNKPNYIFLYRQEDAPSLYKGMLPDHLLIKVA